MPNQIHDAPDMLACVRADLPMVPRAEWPAIAAQAGISLRSLQRLVSESPGTESPRYSSVRAVYGVLRQRQREAAAA